MKEKMVQLYFGAWPCYMYFYIYIYQLEYIRVWSGEYEYRQ